MRYTIFFRADGRTARGNRLSSFQHLLAKLYNAEITSTQNLTISGCYRAHGLPHRHVLSWDAGDTGKVAFFHGFPVLFEHVVDVDRLFIVLIQFYTHLCGAKFTPRILSDAFFWGRDAKQSSKTWCLRHLWEIAFAQDYIGCLAELAL